MRVHFAALALAAATAPFAAHAQEDRVTTRIAVPHGDLDLDRAGDARIMAGRLQKAARRACGGSPLFDPNYDIAPSWAIGAFEECYAAALDGALAQLGARLVTQASDDAHRLARANVRVD